MFSSGQIRNERQRQGLRDAVASMQAGGGTNLNAGLELGYLEVQKNYRSDYTNRVLFLTDGQGESDRVLDMARSYRAAGMNVSTIGVGVGFDMELMMELARQGGGSSRFISDRQEMESIFSTELDRMVVAAARDLEVRLTLADDVQLQDTWGYDYRVDRNVITYRLPTLHNRDYETILARVSYPQGQPHERLPLATVQVSYTDIDGEVAMTPLRDMTLSYASEQNPVQGVTSYRVIQSVAMLDFAEALIEIGQAYEAIPPHIGEDEAENQQVSFENDAELLQPIIERSRLAKAELLAAGRRLDNAGFDDEIEILDNYLTSLTMQAGLDSEELAVIASDDRLPIEQPSRTTIDHLNALFDEVAQHLGGQGISVAVVPFYIRTNILYPPTFNNGLRGYIQETSTSVLSGTPGVNLIDSAIIEAELSNQRIEADVLRDTVVAIDLARSLGTQALITGTVMEMSDSFVIFARVIDSSSEEVIAAAQVVVDKEIMIEDLLGA